MAKIKCSICSSQCDSWDRRYMRRLLSPWFLELEMQLGACSAHLTGWLAIAVPARSAHSPNGGRNNSNYQKFSHASGSVRLSVYSIQLTTLWSQWVTSRHFLCLVIGLCINIVLIGAAGPSDHFRVDRAAYYWLLSWSLDYHFHWKRSGTYINEKKFSEIIKK